MGGGTAAVRGGGLISIVADCGQVQVVGHSSDQVRHFIGGISESDVVEYGNSLGGDAVSTVLFVKNGLSHLCIAVFVVSGSQVFPRFGVCEKEPVRWLSSQVPDAVVSTVCA